jgi:hypothetical protein
MENEHAAIIVEMQEVIDKLFQELVDAGLRTIPRSPEEIAKEAAEHQNKLVEQQNTVISGLLDAVQSLRSEVSEIKAMSTSKTDGERPKYPINKPKKQSADTGTEAKTE